MRAEFDLVGAGFDATAPLASPALSGLPTAPTAPQGTNSTQVATTAFVVAQGFAGVLPGQSGNSGKALVTNGTAAAWGTLGWSMVASTPTTLSGYGITDAAPKASPTLSSPTLTGTAVAPTPAQNDNTTTVATTAFVVGQASNLIPNMDGVGNIGAALLFARSDHVHPVDTSRAPLASPTFTGTVGGITATMVGLGNANNTSDVNKPVSTAATAAFAALAGLSTQTFSVAPATLPAHAAQLSQVPAALGYTPVQQGTGIGQTANTVKIGWAGSRLKATVDVTDLGNIVFDSQLLLPMSAQAATSGTNTTLTVTASLTAPGPGVLIAMGSRNNAGQAGGSNSGTLYINGVSQAGDYTTISMTHFGSTTISAGGAVTAAYTATAGNSFSANVLLIFIPNV